MTEEQRAKRNAYKLAWAKANPEKRAAARKKYDDAHREEKNEYSRVYRVEHSEKHLAACKRWRDNNKAKKLAMTRNRQAAKLQRTPAWLTPEDHAEIDRVYEEAAKKTRETGILHHVDHILPLQGSKVSGLHVPLNLRAIPAKENLKKSNAYEITD